MNPMFDINIVEPLITVTSVQPSPDLRPLEKVPAEIIVKISQKSSPYGPHHINGKMVAWCCPNAYFYIY